jgi:3-keto-5-aminohexanoate cleavage enzyme
MVPTRAQSSHVPLTAPEVIQDVVGCARLGVSVAHLHARDRDGVPTEDLGIYTQMITGIRQQCPDLVVTTITSGRLVTGRQLVAPLR